MKRIIVCIAALVIMLFLFSVALPADISIICAEDVGFEKFYHTNNFRCSVCGLHLLCCVFF